MRPRPNAVAHIGGTYYNLESAIVIQSAKAVISKNVEVEGVKPVSSVKPR